MKLLRMKTFGHSRLQRGITNIQIAMGIAVVGLSIIGGLFLLKYPENQKVKNEVAELMDLRASSVGYATKRGGKYTGLTLATSCAIGFFPEGRCTGAAAATAVSNQWGGAVSLTIVDVNGAGTGIEWRYNGLSPRACIDEVTDLWHSAAKIKIGATEVKDDPTDALAEQATIDACQAADTADIYWTFGPR